MATGRQGKEVVSEGASLRGARQLLRIGRIKHKKNELEHALGTGPSEEIADHCRSDVQRLRPSIDLAGMLARLEEVRRLRQLSQSQHAPLMLLV